jgi:hypothetical protein
MRVKVQPMNVKRKVFSENERDRRETTFDAVLQEDQVCRIVGAPLPAAPAVKAKIPCRKDLPRFDTKYMLTHFNIEEHLHPTRIIEVCEEPTSSSAADPRCVLQRNPTAGNRQPRRDLRLVWRTPIE